MLVMLVSMAFSGVCGLAVVLYFCLDKKKEYKKLDGKHVVVTGGSSGIGKAAAAEAVRLGANVTIIGRDVGKLKEAVKELSRLKKGSQKIQYAALDVTSDYSAIEKCLSNLESTTGPIFMLVNSAGTCVCGQFEKMEIQDIKKMVDLNYFGTAFPTRFVLPRMKKRDEGLIIFVSSEASLMGIYGYSAYSAGKWAVRGLAEALFMELIGSNVRVTLAFPPDTDTPGFEKEELTKPRETKLISGSGGLSSPDYVGQKIIHDAMKGRLYSTFGWSGMVMTTLYCGAIESVGQVVLQVLSMGLIRAIIVPVMLSFHKIIKDGLRLKEIEAKNK